MKETTQTPGAPKRNIPLRSILGVALLVGCFALALQMREQERLERAPKKEQTPEVVTKKSVVSDVSDVSVVRIARRGQAALTFMLDEEEDGTRTDAMPSTMTNGRDPRGTRTP